MVTRKAFGAVEFSDGHVESILSAVRHGTDVVEFHTSTASYVTVPYVYETFSAKEIRHKFYKCVVTNTADGAIRASYVEVDISKIEFYKTV